MTGIDEIAARAYASVYDDVIEIAGARCLRAPGAPDVPMVNRVLGLGVSRPVDDTDLDAVEAAMAGVSYYVGVAPTADPLLDARLAERGFAQGWGWMVFERPPVPVEAAPSSVVVREATSDDAEAWVRVVSTAYGLPAALGDWIASPLSRPSWTGFLALDGDEPVAAAAVWVEGAAAYFGFAGTLPEHRGNGAQGALFAARIEYALSAGCTTLITETGERRDGSPGTSYRNILRHGFDERFVLPHRVRLPPSQD